jgi:hypothetical protein
VSRTPPAHFTPSASNIDEMAKKQEKTGGELSYCAANLPHANCAIR